MSLMKYRPLGRTGMKVSVIGLGTWQLGGEWGRAFAQRDVDALLDRAGELGVNLIDTAECYGNHRAEAFIGDYIARHDRDRWIVATKFGHRFNRFMDRTDDFSPAGAREQIEASLRSLRVKTIDLYQFHSGPDDAFLNPELWVMLEAQRQAGKIRHLGVSIRSKGSELQAREARGLGLDALQVVYNRLDRRAEGFAFPHAERDGLGLLARVPLASGFLAGAYRAGARFPAGDVRSLMEPATIDAQLREAERIRKAEVPAGVPSAPWAIAWCLRDPRVTAVLAGCKSITQVEENASAAGLVDGA
jgi:aryl-alcohol dehydrogenase-like predicted oxidoreductase